VTASQSLVHDERVIQCVGATRRIVGRMNGDKRRTHRLMQGTSAFPWGDDVLRDFQFGRTGCSRADPSGSHRTGRKEKPRQDNSKKSKCAKFHRNHSWRCERKATKGRSVRIVPNHSALRKLNTSGSEAFAKHGQATLRFRSGCLILQNVPVFGEAAVLDPENVRGDPGNRPPRS